MPIISHYGENSLRDGDKRELLNQWHHHKIPLFKKQPTRLKNRVFCQALFTILDVPTVNRQWIKDAQQGRALQSEYALTPWLRWVRAHK